MKKLKGIKIISNNLPVSSVLVPLRIAPNGEVFFTDNETYVDMSSDYSKELRDIKPNAVQCRKFGYYYDVPTRTCKAFNFKLNLESTINNLDNYIEGAKNKTEIDVTNTIILGENNTALSETRNNLIVGYNNKVNSQTINSFALGTNANVDTSNTFVLGGNEIDDTVTKFKQIAKFLYSGATTDNVATKGYLNNTPDSYFVVPNNSIASFKIYTTGIRNGGANREGQIGDFACFETTGALRNINGVNFVQSTVIGTTTQGATSRWVVAITLDENKLTINYIGAIGTNIEWVSSIEITQIKI